MLTILYHKIRGFSRLHIVFKDGKVIADFAHVVVPITTWRLWNQPTMRYPSVRKQRFHRLGNEASDPPVTLAKIAMMLRANAGRSILPQNTIPSPRPACLHQQPFTHQEHATHALAYTTCNCSLCQTPSPRPGLPVVQLFPLPNTQPTPRITRRATVPSAKYPAHAPDYPSCNCSLCQIPSPRPGLPACNCSLCQIPSPRPGLPVVQLFPLPNTQLPAQGRLGPTAAIPTGQVLPEQGDSPLQVAIAPLSRRPFQRREQHGQKILVPGRNMGVTAVIAQRPWRRRDKVTIQPVGDRLSCDPQLSRDRGHREPLIELQQSPSGPARRPRFSVNRSPSPSPSMFPRSRPACPRRPARSSSSTAQPSWERRA